jgi:hypothetical protein
MNKVCPIVEQEILMRMKYCKKRLAEQRTHLFFELPETEITPSMFCIL